MLPVVWHSYEVVIDAVGNFDWHKYGEANL